MHHHPRVDRLWYAAGLLLAVAPLWAADLLPLVDLPQHLHLISVLHRLGDPTTLYPETFALRGELTPYLGYYWVVSLLNWLFPLELANRLFLAATVVALPLSLALLLKALHRPTWPSMLAVPFAYGDSFAWGFLNFTAGLPLAIAASALFVLGINDTRHRRRWAVLLAITSTAVLLFHVQAFAFLAVALPFMLLTTSAHEDRGPDGTRAPWRAVWTARAPVLLGVVPSVALFFVWVIARIGQPAEIQRGVPWKAWGPMLSRENLAFKPFEQNRQELFGVLANQLRDGTDRYALYAVAAVVVFAIALALTSSKDHLPKDARGWVAALRLPGLTLLALVLFFALPFDIRGFSYYLNTRYAHLAAPLAVASVPTIVSLRWRRRLLWASVACAAVLSVTLWRGYAAFDREAAELQGLVAHTAPQPRVMGLIYQPGSRVVTHPVFLHASAHLARERGGLTNFSFALTPHSPLRYRGEPPPTFPSEWQPQAFRYEVHGRAYDHFVLRGAHPRQVLGPQLDGELVVAAQSGSFWLVRRR